YCENAPAVRSVAGDGNGAVMQVHEAPYEGEANPKPTLGTVEGALPLDEKIEDTRQELRRDAESVVLYAQHGVVSLDPNGNRDFSTDRGVLHRVPDDVSHNLLDAHGIALDPC